MPLTCFRRGALLLPFFFFIITVQGQEDLPQDYLTAAFHKGRREAARALMPANSVMVVFAAPTRTFSNDIDYLYHQNPDLYYFTGYKEPHAILFLFKEEQTGINGNKYNELFFVQKRNALAERWTGRRLGAEGVHQKLDIQNVYNGEEFKKYTIPFSSFSIIIMAPLPEDVANNRYDSADLYDLIQQFREKAGITSDKKSEQMDNHLFREITGRLREIKT
ncbi:MAG: aminopeptidase P N-terminal domain-containing protein, partial [Flavisolibacter sp.]|nr:aminopeptidase P N-terminal domain-containing protein [Flavisolibacter sp.]